MSTRILKPLLLGVVMTALLTTGNAFAEKPTADMPTAVQQDEPAPSDTSTAPYNNPDLPPEIIALAPGVPEIDAKSYLLVDFQSGEELAGLNPSLKVEPASITKLMTAYLVYQALGKG
ncbi:MAG: serine-type D-Ala-D-Ala carboxypeptidase, partial [Thiothrix sp.]